MQKGKADFIVHNCRIWTANPSRPWAEAMAVSGSRILAVGSAEEVFALKGEETHIKEAPGKLLLPGFTDSHLHFLDGGFSISGVQLKDARTREEFVTRLKAFAAGLEPGEWILGGNWDHQNWGGDLPSRDWIDAVTPENPVFINRSDGHMALANSLALTIAGIDPSVGELEGGALIRDPNNRLTGICKDQAMSLVTAHIPDRTPGQSRRALQAAMHYVASHGVTAVHHMGSCRELEVFLSGLEDGLLMTRIYAVCPLWDLHEILRWKERLHEHADWLKVGGAKIFTDGSLGSHTAAFFEPYLDQPAERGLMMHPTGKMLRGMLAADREGLQIVMHAIGDRANGLVLDLFEKILDENGPGERRFRIEHAQHLAPEDIPRFGAMKVIASMQPWHCMDDGRWAEKVIGTERCRLTHAWRSLLDAGSRLAFGSDWFVAPPVPLEGIFAAVTRRTLDGKNPTGWIPEQKILLEEALKAYTIDAAYASFDECSRGSLEPGKLADFVILDQDLFSINPDRIPEVKVLETWVGGAVVYKKEERGL